MSIYAVNRPLPLYNHIVSKVSYSPIFTVKTFIASYTRSPCFSRSLRTLRDAAEEERAQRDHAEVPGQRRRAAERGPATRYFRGCIYEILKRLGPGSVASMT